MFCLKLKKQNGKKGTHLVLSVPMVTGQWLITAQLHEQLAYRQLKTFLYVINRPQHTVNV